MKTHFIEEQKFTQWWLWLILGLAGVLTTFKIYDQIILEESFGTNSGSNFGVISSSAFIFFCLLYFSLMKLKTKIDEEKIQIRFFPMVKKTIRWTDIQKAEVVNYGFVGGWGIRLWTQYGTAYNIKGNKGLAIELVNGKKYLIGTQKAAEMSEIVKRAYEPK
jgi:hypothetical protein